MAIFVVETTPSKRSYLSEALAAEGFVVCAAARAEDVRQAQMVLLAAPRADDGVIASVEGLRSRHHSAVILVATDVDDLAERLACYEAGADDCLFRPFHLAEMVAKLRAMQRRNTGDLTLSLMTDGDARVDCGALELRVGERSQGLTKREAELLALLARSDGETVGRERVLQEAWGAPHGMNSNSVDVYVGYVRRKLDQLGSIVTIKTVRGEGFRVDRRAQRSGEADGRTEQARLPRRA